MDDELIGEFITETNESLAELDSDLVTLEQNPNDKDLLGRIFRIMHTIKGTCGFLGLPRLETVAHKAEDVFGLFRDGTLEVTPEYVTLIFESLDRIKYIVGEIEATGSEPEGDDSELKAKLETVYNKATGEGESEAEKTPQQELDEMVQAAREEMAMEGQGDQARQDDQTSIEEQIVEEEQTATGEEEEEESLAVVSAPEEEKQEATQQAARTSSVSAQSLRVSVDVLENLMTMVSELVLTRNQLLQILRMQKESDFTSPLQRLNHVVSDLQEGVMKTRMQPVGNAWAKLPRIIRDISIDLGKKIDLEMRGQDTELDRQVLDLIKDPLTHMVRNSADHGIETPEVRVAAGKPETGKIKLNSYHEGGHIIIEISDDGKGLSTDKIRAKVLANGLATPEELEAMTTQQIHQFIFKAGFSTAEKVTAVSGRGVGMDVVRSNIEKIGGSIELKSVEGKGSRFLIKIPLTLAIVSALIVEAGGERFAIPQLAVRELVMVSASSENKIEMIKGTPVYRLRDHLLPLVSLGELLQLQGLVSPEECADNTVESLVTPDSGQRYIVVAQVGSYSFGLIVDRVFDTEEIVVKPVARILKNIEIFSGNTILGDGSVIMILDPAGVAKSSGEIDMTEASEEASVAGTETDSVAATSLLLFTASGGAPKAVPLELVSRLEEIDVKTIERADGKMVVQYRGSLMPLIPFDGGIEVGEEGAKPVLVFTDDERSMGLIVDEIIDITEQHIEVQVDSSSPHLLGSAIINGKATDVIEVSHYIHKTYGDWYKNHGDEPFGASGDKLAAPKRVLLVEDSPFFRNMLTPLLKVAGYRVTTSENATEALKLCEEGVQFDVIVSDIEMPEMSGFEFAKRVREDSNWQNTPMVALSSHATPQDVDRGLEAGFSKYVPKFDRDTLLSTLSQTLSKEDAA